MVTFNLLRDLAQKELSECLDKYTGTKILVWDEGLTGPFDLIAKYQFFRDRGVIKMFPLKPGRLPPTKADSIIFITRPEIANMDFIADNVLGEDIASGSGHRSEFVTMFVPNKSLLCEMRLTDRGVLGSFSYMDELAISWFPLETDIISLEKISLFREYNLDKDQKDPTCLFPLAKAMMALQAVYGVIPKIYGKGRAAKQLFDFMARLRREHITEEPAVRPQIDTLIILDRQVDLVTPLITQLTYEGLIDEFFNIRHSCVKLPSEKFLAPVAGSEDQGLVESRQSTKQFTLSSNEELYAKLRDKNFNAVGPTLSKEAKAVSAQFEERHGAKTVKDFKLFVDRLPQMQVIKQSLATHTSIAELIKERTDNPQFLEFLQAEQEIVNYQNTHRALDFIEDSACQDVDLVKVLRIACLQSVINSGLKPKLLEAYRKLLLQAYGHKHILSLVNLEKAGLLTAQQGGGSTGNYAVLRKRLHLTQDDVNELNPTDISYVHSVYAPLSIRLVQNCIYPGWKSIKDILDLLSGPSFEESQHLPLHLQPGRRSANDDDVIVGNGTKKTLVLFVGGCTFAEISSLRFLSSLEDSTAEYLIGTTAIITGDKLIESLLNPLKDSLGF